MGLFDRKPGGFMDQAQAWMTPARADALSALGQGFSQMSVGRPVDLTNARNAMMQRQQRQQQKQALESSGLLDKFTPEQRAILATMPPAAAQKVIAAEMFKGAPAPTKGVAVGGRIVDPVTGRVIYEPSNGADPEYTRLTPEEVAAIPGLDPNKVYQRSPKGQISAIGGGGQVINVGPTGADYGEPGPGLVWQRDGEGEIALDERGAPIAIPFQGGSVWQSQQQAEEKGETAAAQTAEKDALAQRAGKVVLEDIDRMRGKIEDAPWYSPTTGFFGDIFKDIGGTQAADVKQLGQTIRGNIGFDRLQQMRDASPTGGALGQVSQQELATLQSVLGSLEQSQTESQLLENLDRLEKIYSGIMKKFSAYPNADEFGISGPAAGDDPLGLR